MGTINTLKLAIGSFNFILKYHNPFIHLIGKATAILTIASSWIKLGFELNILVHNSNLGLLFKLCKKLKKKLKKILTGVCSW